MDFWTNNSKLSCWKNWSTMCSILLDCEEVGGGKGSFPCLHNSTCISFKNDSPFGYQDTF